MTDLAEEYGKGLYDLTEEEHVSEDVLAQLRVLRGLFRDQPDTPKDATFVPVVFPLIAGAGALTTLLSIRSQYSDISILAAVIANMVIVYLVLKLTKKIESILGRGFIYMIQKFFGIILLAISVKLFMANITRLLAQLN